MSSGFLCNQDLGDWLNPNCAQPRPLDGGIEYIVVAVGDIESHPTTPITDPSVKAQWTAAIDAGNVILIGPVLGQKAAASTATKKLSSAVPPAPTNQTHSVTWQDFNTTKDNTDNYRNLMETGASRAIGYITAHGWPASSFFRGWATNGSIISSEVIEANSEDGSVMWEGSVNWDRMGELTRYTMAELTPGVDF